MVYFFQVYGPVGDGPTPVNRLDSARRDKFYTEIALLRQPSGLLMPVAVAFLHSV